MAAERTPECPDDNVVLIERVVDVAGYLTEVDAAQAANAGFSIGRTRSRQKRHNA